ncbi:hypothetical protein C8R46DRAFT_1196436 [Mycena filopes]|nr:hypothetical protein C8R46DRAFT_1196436 [Mycena filopes]
MFVGGRERADSPRGRALHPSPHAHRRRPGTHKLAHRGLPFTAVTHRRNSRHRTWTTLHRPSPRVAQSKTQTTTTTPTRPTARGRYNPKASTPPSRPRRLPSSAPHQARPRNLKMQFGRTEKVRGASGDAYDAFTKPTRECCNMVGDNPSKARPCARADRLPPTYPRGSMLTHGERAGDMEGRVGEMPRDDTQMGASAKRMGRGFLRAYRRCQYGEGRSRGERRQHTVENNSAHASRIRLRTGSGTESSLPGQDSSWTIFPRNVTTMRTRNTPIATSTSPSRAQAHQSRTHAHKPSHPRQKVPPIQRHADILPAEAWAPRDAYETRVRTTRGCEVGTQIHQIHRETHRSPMATFCPPTHPRDAMPTTGDGALDVEERRRPTRKYAARPRSTSQPPERPQCDIPTNGEAAEDTEGRVGGVTRTRVKRRCTKRDADPPRNQPTSCNGVTHNPLDAQFRRRGRARTGPRHKASSPIPPRAKPSRRPQDAISNKEEGAGDAEGHLGEVCRDDMRICAGARLGRKNGGDTQSASASNNAGEGRGENGTAKANEPHEEKEEGGKRCRGRQRLTDAAIDSKARTRVNTRSRQRRRFMSLSIQSLHWVPTVESADLHSRRLGD